MWQKLKSWVKEKIKEQWIRFRTWLNVSRFVLGITMLTIGISGTFVYIHREDFKIVKTIRIQIAEADEDSRGQILGDNPVTPVAGIAPHNSGDLVYLVKKYFGNEADVALAIARAESGLDPKMPSTTDKTIEGRSYSIGLFQINLTVSEIAGVNCSKAFEGKNNQARIVDESLFAKCVKLAENPVHNIEVAKKKYESRGNWTAWGGYNNGSYLKFLNI